MHSHEKDKVFNLAGKIFREEDEIPLLQKALYLCDYKLSFIAVENNQIIGFTLVCKTMTNVYYPFMTMIPNCYELAFLGIAPDSQGRGLGSRLLKESINAIFQQTKQFTCWLLVDVTNVSAIKMYQKLGFRQWVTTPSELSYKEGFVMGLSHRRYHTSEKPERG
jgi:ribosomal protein S18 acetylase RimI-like enzyme